MTARVAVINDDLAFRAVMLELLTDEGHETHAFRADTQDYPLVRDLAPDAIILDVRLEHPEAGWDLLELLRLDPATTQTPLIVCAADGLRKRTLYLQSPRGQVLSKPFDRDTLLDLLRQVLGPTARKTSEAL
jgi:CheY-like chemotaxis protein